MNKQLLWPAFIAVWLLAVGIFVASPSSAPAEAAAPARLSADAIGTPAPVEIDSSLESDLIMEIDTASPTPTDTATETSQPTDTPVPSDTVVQSRLFAPLPALSPTLTPQPDGHSELRNNELASAALVGKLDPSRSLPPDINDCRWQQPDNARLICHVQVFLPPGYFVGAERYPVLYLLHGWGGWDTGTHTSEWDSKFNFFAVAGEMMRNGQLPPFIIVAPEGGHNYWFNHAADDQRWGDFVAQEVVSYVDSSYRTIPRASSRAIAGLSMGGLGAIQLALNHPGEFDVVGMRSPTLRRSFDPDDAPFFGDASYYADYDPFVLANRVQSMTGLSLYIIIGDQDMWLQRTQEFRALLDQKQASYDWHVYPGGHDGDFFGSHLDEELAFYGAHLAAR